MFFSMLHSIAKKSDCFLCALFPVVPQKNVVRSEAQRPAAGACLYDTKEKQSYTQSHSLVNTDTMRPFHLITTSTLHLLCKIELWQIIIQYKMNPDSNTFSIVFITFTLLYFMFENTFSPKYCVDCLEVYISQIVVLF